jgi:hypothetical protein
LQASRPHRLDRVFDYAEDRAGYLDVHQSTVAVLDSTTDLDTNERADLVIAAIQDTTMRTLIRRLEREPRMRELVATFVVAAVLP